jgi:hypothetical protein
MAQSPHSEVGWFSTNLLNKNISFVSVLVLSRAERAGVIVWKACLSYKLSVSAYFLLLKKNIQVSDFRPRGPAAGWMNNLIVGVSKCKSQSKQGNYTGIIREHRYWTDLVARMPMPDWHSWHTVKMPMPDKIFQAFQRLLVLYSSGEWWHSSSFGCSARRTSMGYQAENKTRACLTTNFASCILLSYTAPHW